MKEFSFLSLLACIASYAVANGPNDVTTSELRGALWVNVSEYCEGNSVVPMPCNLDNGFPGCTGTMYPFGGPNAATEQVNDHLTDCNNAACPFAFDPSQQAPECED